MKKIAILLSFFLVVISCETQKPAQTNTEESEWEVVVFDAEYESFVRTRARPISQYSLEFLKSRNRILVPEWNSRYRQGVQPSLYESIIDYDSSENYGIEFEYRLYQFFAYVNWRYGARFNGLSATDTFN